MTSYLSPVGVQQFSITIASGSLTGTATINAVGSGAFIIFGGINPSISNQPTESEAYLTLTNSTTITATRHTSTAGTVVITGSIVDGDTINLIKSVQYGTVAIASGSTSGTASISAVTNNNTAIHYLGHASSQGSLNAQREGAALTLSGTTVTATVVTAPNGAGFIVGFVAIEFQGTALNQAVQNIAAASSGTGTSWTASLTSLVVNNTITLPGGGTVGASITTNEAARKTYGTVTNSTTFTANVNTGNAGVKTYYATIVEFVSGVLNSAVQRGTTTLTGTTSNTSSITAVGFTNSALSFLGNTTTTTTALEDQAQGAAALTDGSTVTVTKVTATANITGSWEVWEFSISISWFPRYRPQNENPLIAAYSYFARSLNFTATTLAGTGGAIAEFAIAEAPIAGSTSVPAAVASSAYVYIGRFF